MSDNISSENFVQAFPNPFVNNFSVYLHNFGATKVYFKIYDSNGRLMYNQNLSVNGSLYQQINTQLFSKGTYFFSVQTNNGFKFVKKILKQ